MRLLWAGLLVSMAVLGAAALLRREPLPAHRDLLRIAAFGVLFFAGYCITLNAAERRVVPSGAAWATVTAAAAASVLLALMVFDLS